MSEIDNRVYRQAEFDGYAFLFTPPSQANRYASVHIDYGALAWSLWLFSSPAA